MENINLCEILKGHEGETFYSPLLCDLILEKIDIAVVYFRYGSSLIGIQYHGKDLDNKVCIFPSKDQRDWNKWIEEQKSVQVEPKFNIGDKVLCKTHEIDIESICIISSYNPKAKEYKLLCGNATITYCKENCLEPYFDKGDRVVVTHGKYKNSVGIIEEYSADDDTWSITLNGYDYPINFAKEWIKKQKLKVPKTWSELEQSNDSHIYGIEHRYNDDYYVTREGNTPIEKSAIALFKIHQLIEVGYGGNINNEEWFDYDNCIYTIEYNSEYKIYKIITAVCYKRHIAFHTKKQAEEFLKYPENVQLLKDYFMIN